MPAYNVTIYYTDTSNQARSWTGRRNGRDDTDAVVRAADQLRSRPSVLVVTGGTAIEIPG
jgi:hypothetical protein